MNPRHNGKNKNRKLSRKKEEKMIEFAGTVFVADDDIVYMLVEQLDSDYDNGQNLCEYKVVNITNGLMTNIHIANGTDKTTMRQEIEVMEEKEIIQEFQGLFDVQHVGDMEMVTNTNVVRYFVNGHVIQVEVEAFPTAYPEDIAQRGLEILKTDGIDITHIEHEWEIGM